MVLGPWVVTVASVVVVVSVAIVASVVVVVSGVVVVVVSGSSCVSSAESNYTYLYLCYY